VSLTFKASYVSFFFSTLFFATVIKLFYIHQSCYRLTRLSCLLVLSDAHRYSHRDGVGRRRWQEDAKILSLWT